VGRLLHLPSAETVSVRPYALPRIVPGTAAARRRRRE